MADKRYIITFPSTHTALQAERAALRAEIRIRMIPVPRKLSADCNMGMETSQKHWNSLRTLLAAKSIECNFVILQKPASRSFS